MQFKKDVNIDSWDIVENMLDKSFEVDRLLVNPNDIRKVQDALDIVRNFTVEVEKAEKLQDDELYGRNR